MTVPLSSKNWAIHTVGYWLFFLPIVYEPWTDDTQRRKPTPDRGDGGHVDEHDAFFTLHRDLPREGPGHRDSTARALFTIPTLCARPRILDLGCGPGASTIDLALLLPDATLTALDAHAPFLETLMQRARAAGVADRVTPVRGDLRIPPPGEYDLIWCEGAAYLMGFTQALTAWEPLLAYGGSIALSEPVWLTDLAPSTLPQRLRACWAEYPDMQSLQTRRRQIESLGLRNHGDFVLPARDWWESYYDPITARISALRAPPESLSPELLAVLDAAEEEMAVYREHGTLYGYAFFVVGRPQDEDEPLYVD